MKVASLKLLQIVSAIVLLADMTTLGLASFNCTRPGSGCFNGGMCDQVNGGCICMGSTFTGYDCSQERQYIMQGTCLSHNPCRNGGTCYDIAVTGSQPTALCYCPYDFYGRHCELPTVQSECYSDQMVINVNPGANFMGVVNIQHKTGFCPMVPVSSQVEFSLDPVRSKWEGFAAILPFKGSVCGAGPTKNTTATEVIYTYDILVGYDTTGTKPEMDEIISFSCPTPNLAGGVIGPTAVLFSVSDAYGAVVDRPKLGSPVTITFNVDPASIFTDIMVQDCKVFNSEKTKSKPVVEHSCPVHPFGKSLVKQGKEHVLTLIVHTFGRDPRLAFECTVKVCTVSDTSCQKLPTCPILTGPPSVKPLPADQHPVDPHGPIPTAPNAPPPPYSQQQTDIFSLLGGGGGSGGDSSILTSLLSGGAGGGSGPTQAAAVDNLMNSLGPASGSPNTASTRNVQSGSSNFMNELMALTSGAVMNDLIFPGGQAPQGPTYGEPGILSGPLQPLGRRRRDVNEDLNGAEGSYHHLVVVRGTMYEIEEQESSDRQKRNAANTQEC